MQAAIGIKIHHTEAPLDDLPSNCWAVVYQKQTDGTIHTPEPTAFGRVSDCKQPGTHVLEIPWEAVHEEGSSKRMPRSLTLRGKSVRIDLYELQKHLRFLYEVCGC